MAKRFTKKIRYICLPEKRIREIEDLVASWPNETKVFMRARLNQYSPSANPLRKIYRAVRWLFVATREKKHFEILKDPDILTDWQKRFEISGQATPREAWNRILEKEVSSRDYSYLLALLDKELSDVHVPLELETLFEKIYRAHIRKEYIADPEVPKAPIILFIGTSGSGKSATAGEVIEKVIFANEVQAEVDLTQKKESILAKVPFWRSLDDVSPVLAQAINRRKKIRYYKFLSRLPLISILLKKNISRNLSDLEDQTLEVDFSRITPNDYQTSLAGEPGNYLQRAFGQPYKTCIRHVEEAHSAFGRSESREHGGVERQQRTLIDTSNIILDEIANGSRDCLLIATSDQPEMFDAAIYRRFVEKGLIIDISEYWMNPANLREIVRIELMKGDIRVTDKGEVPASDEVTNSITLESLESAVDKFYAIFSERSLKITPAYVRKMVHSILSIKGEFSADQLDDPLLVRKAFEMVARNAFGDLFNKVVDRMERNAHWDEYVGDVKNMFSEMANNCLQYNVSDEKGVVLNGPPGSGKTFLVRSWLSENVTIHDISTSPNALQDPVNPIDGMVNNLEKLYDIAKMIAPTVVFFDEGDSLAPRRSSTGGSPTDRLTNKFLNIIDGEKPLSKVLTVLTTNRLDLLDPALIRSKRLKVLEVSGQLRQHDVTGIIEAALRGTPQSRDITPEAVIESAKGICNTPADYAAFIDKALALRSTEYTVLNKFRTVLSLTRDEQENFVKFNLKTLTGILDAVKAPTQLCQSLRRSPLEFLSRHDEINLQLEHVQTEEHYPLSISHLHFARQEMSQSPVRRGKMDLDDFLEAELSQEPQVGFVVGVGANEIDGVLLPIATSLTYRLSSEKILVTGAVSSSGSASAQMEMAVQMTQQSAQEALTLVKNYFQSLEPGISMAKLLGEFLYNYTLHHQLLSASYSVGGPSAGYALALNTLSAIIHIPILNDFGITGAPWTKGVTKGEVGGSVIIGGHQKKTEKVLQHLRRMYMPRQNYHSLENEFLINYWTQDKDILEVSHFGDLVPETIWLGQEYDEVVQELINLRISFKISKYQNNTVDQEAKEKIIRLKAFLRTEAENEMIRRLHAIRDYLRNPDRDPLSSLEAIFQEHHGGMKKVVNMLSPLKKFLKMDHEE
ncbi:AAA family ATPase [Thermodesulfobacteriota bacterium]